MTKEQVQSVIDAMYSGTSVKRACEKLGLKSTQYFHKALLQYPELATEYECAQQAKSEDFAEEIIEIADEEPDAMKARNRIDSRRWYAAVMKPKKFGERIDLNITETIDIRGALEEARSRVLLPLRDPNQIGKAKPIEIASVNLQQPSDKQSDNADANEKLREELLK